MGVDFLICHFCEGTFPDCGSYIRCGPSCYNKWCSDSCAKEEGYDPEGGYDKEYHEANPELEEEDCRYQTCNFCRNEAFEEYELLGYALKLLGMDEVTLIAKLKESKKS